MKKSITLFDSEISRKKSKVSTKALGGYQENGYVQQHSKNYKLITMVVRPNDHTPTVLKSASRSRAKNKYVRTMEPIETVMNHSPADKFCRQGPSNVRSIQTNVRGVGHGYGHEVRNQNNPRGVNIQDPRSDGNINLKHDKVMNPKYSSKNVNVVNRSRLNERTKVSLSQPKSKSKKKVTDNDKIKSTSANKNKLNTSSARGVKHMHKRMVTNAGDESHGANNKSFNSNDI